MVMPTPRVDVHGAPEAGIQGRLMSWFLSRATGGEGGSCGIQRGRTTPCFTSLALTDARTANHWLVSRAGNFRVRGTAGGFI